MKNKNLRSKAILYSQGLEEEFSEVGDKRGAQLFGFVKAILQMNEMTLSRLLYVTIQFSKAEMANHPSSN